MKLIASNPNPQPTSNDARIGAVIARAIMTDSAPASFFGTGFYLDEHKEQSNATNQSS